MTNVKERPNYPLFQRYTIDELSRRLGYSDGYLVFIKNGYRMPSKRFKTTVCAVLNQSEVELFGSPEISGEVK